MSETITPQPFDRSAMTNKWQSKREEKKVYQTTESSDKPKYFALDMFPYPSGAGLHVGHPKGYIATDVISRKKHLEGYNVLHPMGFDSFGLPTENYAMKNKIHPSQATDENIATFIGQLKKIGFNYDRDRMISTADPEFYKRTQRQFLQIYHHYFDHTEQKAKPISELREILKRFITTANNTDYSKKYLIFDFDGVLADTFAASNETRVKLGFASDLEDAANKQLAYANNPVDHSKNTTMTIEQLNDRTQFLKDRGAIQSTIHFDVFTKFIDEIVLIDKTQVAIVSSNSNQVLESKKEELKKLNPTHILCFENHHSKEEKIEQICRDRGVDVSEVYYFTDTRADVFELQDYISNGKLIGCAWGRSGYDGLSELLDPEYIMKEFSDIHKIVENGKQNIENKEITNFQNRYQTQTKSDPQFFASLTEEEKIEYYLDTEKRIAYISTAPINRCPSCMTALANEDLDGNNCERCGSTIERKKMRQWMIRITDYAQRLLDGLDLLPDRQDNIKAMQRHWIGKSEGTIVKFGTMNGEGGIDVYTTRIDTVFGVTYVAIAPEYPDIEQYITPDQKAIVLAYIEESKNKTDLQRQESKEKTGVRTGSYVINPFNNEQVPLRVADYVLMDYGTGAVMAVPAHDERDWEFAHKYDLKIKPVIYPVHSERQGIEERKSLTTKIGNKEICYTEKGSLTSSGMFEKALSEDAIPAMQSRLAERGLGGKKINYRLNNRVFSRQRYWGEPIPFVYKEANSNSQLTIHNSQLICLGSFKGSHLLLNTEKQAELMNHHEYTEDGCVHVVSCIIKDSEGKIYVHHNALKNEFFFPGGKVDTGETVEQASVRELKEELELTIAIEDVKRLSSMKVIHGGVKRCFHMVDILHYEGTIVDHETAKYDHYRAEIIASDNAFGFAVKVDGTITDDIYDIMHTFVDIYNMKISLPQLDNDGTQGVFEQYDISSIDTSASYYQYYDQSQKKYFFSNKYIPTNIAIFGQPQFNINGEKDSSYALLYSKETHRYCIVYDSNGKHGLPGGTVDAGETFEQALHREVQEETGYSNISIKKGPQLIYAFYRVGEKGGESNIERWNKANFFLCELENDTNSGQSLTSDEIGMGYKRVNKEELLLIFSQHGDKRDLWNAFMRQGIDSVLDNQEPSNSQLAANHNRIRVTPMDASELPLTLPDVAHYEPTGTEEGPLAKIESWINTTLSDGTPARRESNTMPGWAGSSRYRLRYMDPRNQQTMLSPDKEQYRGQVDLYVGGMEHACRHLIYARFWHKFLKDIGVVSTEEPFKKLVGVGLVLAEDGRKMSKRRGNVINPDDVIAEFGTDAFRTYEMFMGPFGSEVARSTAGVKGVRKFLDKIIKLSLLVIPAQAENSLAGSKEYKKALTLLHKTIKKVSEDIDDFAFNTAISALMIYVNHLEEVFPCREGAEGGRVIPLDLFEPLIQLIAPFAPHLTEELREKLGHTTMLYEAKNWPSYDPALLVDDVITMGVQFNGKMKGTIEIAPTATQDEAIALIQADAKLASNFTGDTKKIIYVPGRILNIVVG